MAFEIRGLVVDNNVRARESIVCINRIATRTGLAIAWDEAATVREAELALEKSPRIVITEASLGSDQTNRDGLRVAYAARDVTHHVIMLTAYTLDGDFQLELLEIGVPWVTKPISPSRLVDVAVRSALETPRPRVRRSRGSIAYAADVLRSIDAPLKSVLDDVGVMAATMTVDDHGGCIAAAAEAARVSRHWLNRRVSRRSKNRGITHP